MKNTKNAPKKGQAQKKSGQPHPKPSHRKTKETNNTNNTNTTKDQKTHQNPPKHDEKRGTGFSIFKFGCGKKIQPENPSVEDVYKSRYTNIIILSPARATSSHKSSEKA